MEDIKLEQEILKLIGHDQDAINFLLVYNECVHRTDDIIDEKITDAEFILKTQSLWNNLWNSNLARRFPSLWLVDQLVNNIYADSILWEKEEEPWKRVAADVWRHQGQEVVFAVILLVAGRDALREISIHLREKAHKEHLNDNIDYSLVDTKLAISK